MAFQKGHPKFKNAYSFQKGNKNPRWKGGRFKHTKGYTLILKPEHPFCDYKGYIMEHRLILEQKLGRFLKPTEYTHHINGIPDDNRPENLHLCSNNAEHKKLHRKH